MCQQLLTNSRVQQEELLRAWVSTGFSVVHSRDVIAAELVDIRHRIDLNPLIQPRTTKRHLLVKQRLVLTRQM